jgi:hypothetical protein
MHRKVLLTPVTACSAGSFKFRWTASVMITQFSSPDNNHCARNTNQFTCLPQILTSSPGAFRLYGSSSLSLYDYTVNIQSCRHVTVMTHVTLRDLNQFFSLLQVRDIRNCNSAADHFGPSQEQGTRSEPVTSLRSSTRGFDAILMQDSEQARLTVTDK